MVDNKKIAIIGGARPNFMKVAPLVRELEKQKINHLLINTGQHFSREMAEDFFVEFGIRPDYNIFPRRDSVVTQFCDIMIELEKIFLAEKPSLVVVVGDVNSTLAGSIVANKMNIKLAHLEAGLRSYNDKMPEEINRVLTDRISNLLFVTSEEGIDNLKKEGISKNIYFVGNIMIDTLEMFLPDVKKTEEKFFFCTLHRAENVDDEKIFGEILDALEIISKDNKIYLPLHPRTRKMAEKHGYLQRIKNIFEILPPISYKDSLYYQSNAELVLTDSGGIQEETSYLGTPCITLRTETERPITVTNGTNTIGGVSKNSILEAYEKQTFKKTKTSIPHWDGKVAERVVEIINNY